jgi:hypothetical protein
LAERDLKNNSSKRRGRGIGASSLAPILTLALRPSRWWPAIEGERAQVILDETF